MLKWRIIAVLAFVAWLMAQFHVLGFHERTPLAGAVSILGIVILNCICDAVDVLRAALQSGADK